MVLLDAVNVVLSEKQDVAFEESVDLLAEIAQDIALENRQDEMQLPMEEIDRIELPQ